MRIDSALIMISTASLYVSTVLAVMWFEAVDMPFKLQILSSESYILAAVTMIIAWMAGVSFLKKILSKPQY